MLSSDYNGRHPSSPAVITPRRQWGTTVAATATTSSMRWGEDWTRRPPDENNGPPPVRRPNTVTNDNIAAKPHQPNLATAVVAVVDLPLPPPSTLPDTPHDIDSPARCSSRPPLYLIVILLFFPCSAAPPPVLIVRSARLRFLIIFWANNAD